MSDGSPPRPFEHPSAVVFLEARYVIALETGNSIQLPAEVLWAFSLNEGDLLLCEHSLGMLTFASYTREVRTLAEAVTHPWPFLEREVFSKPMEAVGPGGRVSLPDRFVETLHLQPGDRLWLEAKVDGWRRLLSLRRWAEPRRSP